LILGGAAWGLGSPAVRSSHAALIHRTQRLSIPCGPAGHQSARGHNLERVDQHDVPLDAMATVATALKRILEANGQTLIRQVMGGPETLREAVDQLDAYLQFQPEHFDRRDVNALLRALVQQEEASP
jgi:hypothetical protein